MVDITIVKTNHFMATAIDSKHSAFQGMVKFLNNSYLGYAMTAQPLLNGRVLAEFWRSAEADGEGNLVYNLDDPNNSHTISADVVNEVLQLPRENLVAAPTEEQFRELLMAIGYSDDIEGLAKLDRKFLRMEWSFFFDALTKVFSAKTGGYNAIISLVLKIAYAVLKNINIDIGELILNELMDKVGNRTFRSKIYYPRFIQLIIEHQTGGVSSTRRVGDHLAKPLMQGARIFNDLIAAGHNLSTPYVEPTTLAGTLSYTGEADADEESADEATSSSFTSNSSSSGEKESSDTSSSNPSPPPSSIPPLSQAKLSSPPKTPQTATILSSHTPSSTHPSPLAQPQAKRFKTVVAGPKKRSGTL